MNLTENDLLFALAALYALVLIARIIAANAKDKRARAAKDGAK